MLPIEQMAVVNRIEFCDAAKNSGVVLYVRKWNCQQGKYEEDLLDTAILDWIHHDYPEVLCYSHEIVCREEVEDLQNFKKNLNQETLPIYLTQKIEFENIILGQQATAEIEIYCFEQHLNYPRAYILVSTKDQKEFENVRSTYMTFSEYEALLQKDQRQSRSGDENEKSQNN